MNNERKFPVAWVLKEEGILIHVICPYNCKNKKKWTTHIHGKGSYDREYSETDHWGTRCPHCDDVELKDYKISRSEGDEFYYCSLCGKPTAPEDFETIGMCQKCRTEEHVCKYCGEVIDIESNEAIFEMEDKANWGWALVHKECSDKNEAKQK